MTERFQYPVYRIKTFNTVPASEMRISIFQKYYMTKVKKTNYIIRDYIKQNGILSFAGLNIYGEYSTPEAAEFALKMLAYNKKWAMVKE